MGSELRYDGRVAIVTGAGGGIGRAHALLLAKRGAIVVITELPAHLSRAEAVREEILAAGGEALAVGGRVGTDDDARHLVAMTIDQYEKIDIIVHNAGTVGDKVIVQEDPGPGFDQELDVNLRGPLQINRAAWPHLASRRYGRILFTSSSVALGWYREPHGYEGSYASAKASIFGSARQTAAAGEEFNIKANILMPGAYTPMVDANLAGTELGNWMKANLKPETVAAGAAYLLHENCPVTGQLLSVAGGRVARIFYASPEGYFNRDLTPEDVRDNWNAIHGVPDASGKLFNCVEITSQAGEYEIISKVLRG
jgi:NAD(P)-dependent dehydrogenase (short-subunit alcohol dehydrogenase family)